jgi:serine/threonine protein phosphatase PrpC
MNNEDITVESNSHPRPADNIRLTCASFGISDIGCKRLHNEDAYLTSAAQGLWAVADGMGGHNAGDFASQSVVTALHSIPADAALDDALFAVEAAMHAVNQRLIDIANDISDHTVIGTTLAMLLAREQRGVVLWVGDSRVYRIRDERLEMLTKDHSLLNDMVDKGMINFEDTLAHPGSNKITRSIGSRNQFELDLRNLAILPADRYIICSDGLTRYLNDEKLGMIASPAVNHNSKTACTALVQAALDAGTTDNVTAIVIDFSEVR